MPNTPRSLDGGAFGIDVFMPRAGAGKISDGSFFMKRWQGGLPTDATSTSAINRS